MYYIIAYFLSSLRCLTPGQRPPSTPSTYHEPLRLPSSSGGTSVLLRGLPPRLTVSGHQLRVILAHSWSHAGDMSCPVPLELGSLLPYNIHYLLLRYLFAIVFNSHGNRSQNLVTYKFVSEPQLIYVCCLSQRCWMAVLDFLEEMLAICSLSLSVSWYIL